MRRERRTPNRCHRVAAAVFVAALPCGAQAAGGSTSQAPSAARAESASTLVLRGVKLYKEHRYDAARDAFDQAYKLDPQPGTLLNLALSELKADQPVEADAHFREYLKAAHEPEAKLDSVRTTYLPLAESEIAQLDIQTSAAAEVFVDGGALSPTMVASERAAGNGRVVSVLVRAGEHAVSARQGSSEQTQRVTAKGGEIVEVHLERVQSETPRPELSASPVETPATLPGDDSGKGANEVDHGRFARFGGGRPRGTGRRIRGRRAKPGERRVGGDREGGSQRHAEHLFWTRRRLVVVHAAE